jgi:hypothetical protein
MLPSSHYQKALDGLRADSYTVKEEDPAHPSPTRYAHINPYGRHRFDLGGVVVGAGPVGIAVTRGASVARTDGRYGRG